jgi:hypothetical protein
VDDLADTGEVTDGSHASGDLAPIRQWLVMNRQFPFRSVTPCQEDGSGRNGTGMMTSCCGV